MHRIRSAVYGVLAAVNLLLSIFLIRRWGCVGAALGTAIVQLIGTFAFSNWYYHKKVGLNMILFWKEIGKLAPAFGAVFLVGLVYGHFVEITGWKMLLVSGGLLVAVYAVVIWCMGLNEYEKQLIRKMVNRTSGAGRGGE
jgi:O-antigen/teichoic acid export membrane protein